MLLLTAALLLTTANRTLAAIYGVTDCASVRYGADLVCTAGDVSITGIAVAAGSPTSCVGGSTFTVDLDITVNFAVPDRWDIGIFLSRDGNDPQLRPVSGGATSCSVAILPLTTPFLNLDSNGGADTCGDGNGSINNGTGSGVLRMSAVPVSCKATNLSNGNLFIPFVVSWDNTKTPPGDVCTSIANPVPNTKSKCNAPDGTVAAEVQFGTINAVVLPSISKSDVITTITAGDSTSYEVVITNTTGAALSNVIFRDPAVANLTVDSLSCSAAGGASCPASYPIASMQGGGITLPSMPVASSVTFTVGATVSAATPAGTITNTASATVRGESTSASDTNNVIRKFETDKSFTPRAINAGETSQLQVTLQNNNLTDATNVAFTDTYPANLVNVTPLAVTNSCGGTVTATTAAPWSLALAGGSIPAGGSCSVTVDVTSAVNGVYLNQTGAITSDQYTGASAAAFLAVGASSLETSTKGWQDLNGGEANPGDTIRYTLTLIETAGVPALGVSLSDLVPATLNNLTVTSCPVGATCGFSGQTLTATGITVPANGSVSVTFSATIASGTAAGTEINNCATITNPLGVGATPCAPPLPVSPSAVAISGNKPLYLSDGTTLSRAKPAGTPAAVTIANGASSLWPLSPTLALPVTISPSVTPLAIIPVNLYLASNVASSNRTVQVTVACSGGGPTYSQTKIFDGTAVNNPYLPTTPTLVAFNNLTLSADHTCAAGQSWNLTVRNGSAAGNVLVYPVSGGNNSYISLPSLNVINVDSVNNYDAAYPAVTTPPSGYYLAGETAYLRAVISDPFGSYDINANPPATLPTVTLTDPGGNLLGPFAMTELGALTTAATKTFEYAYTIPASGPAGNWTARIDAVEGTEGNVFDYGIGTFEVVVPLPLISISKTASTSTAKPGAVIAYSVQITNSGIGVGHNVALRDILSRYGELRLDTNGAGAPFVFSDSSPVSGLTPENPEYTDDNSSPYIPGATGYDGNVATWRIPMSGTIRSGGSFTINYEVKVE